MLNSEVLALPGRWLAWLWLVTQTTIMVVPVAVSSITVKFGGQNAAEIVTAAEEAVRATTTAADEVQAAAAATAIAP